MLVSKDNLEVVIADIASSERISFDTETNGLEPYKGDTLFAASISTAKNDYYFDFREVLPRSVIPRLLEGFSGIIFMHNAKFDAAFLLKEGLDVFKHTVHDTMAIGRVVENTAPSLTLASLGAKLGHKKLDVVKEYVETNKLYTKTADGKKILHYDKVPNEVMPPYAEADARITYQLGVYQNVQLDIQARILPSGKPTPDNVAKNEIALTPVLAQMERIGIKIDRKYTKLAYTYEKSMAEKAVKKFTEATGEEFVDSGKSLADIFKRKYDITLPMTDKYRPSADEDALLAINHPVGNIVLEYRKAAKKISTYYGPMLDLCDSTGVIHCSFFQCGAQTGRFSCRTPNLQNLPKVEDASSELYQVRKCFVPREDYSLFSFDYQQAEYRLMLDLAGELPIINKILSGVDVHQATAHMLKCTRKHAKTINFGLLYGCGIQTLADMLGCSYNVSAELKKEYYAKLPKVGEFIQKVIDTAKQRGFIFNWFGRRYNFTPSTSYKAPNYLIQGGCADIIKKVMVELHAFLADKKSRMLVQVHDELLFELHKNEVDLVPQIKGIIEGVYPHKYLPLTCSIESSDISWQDKKEWSLTSTKKSGSQLLLGVDKME